MGCFDSKGNGICQGTGCEAVGPADVQVLRAIGWHYGSGVTIGGGQYEALLCPHCARDERRRVVTRVTMEQDQLPIEWGQYQAAVQGEGFQSR